jgi:hypothetical protein
MNVPQLTRHHLGRNIARKSNVLLEESSQVRSIAPRRDQGYDEGAQSSPRSPGASRAFHLKTDCSGAWNVDT